MKSAHPEHLLKLLTFESLPIPEPVLQGIRDAKFKTCTPIQSKSLPITLAHKDLAGQAQTGTGKTAAFALPMLANIDPEERKPQLLVLAPTRELAIQVAEAFQVYASFSQKIKVLPGQLAAGSTPRRCPDTSKIQSLGFKPQVSLVRGIGIMTKWYQAHTNEKQTIKI